MGRSGDTEAKGSGAWAQPLTVSPPRAVEEATLTPPRATSKHPLLSPAMSADRPQNIAPLARCGDCRGWHRFNELLCPICGRETKLGAPPFFSRMPLLASLTVAIGVFGVLFMLFGGNRAAQMASLVVIVAWGSALRYLWPKRKWGPRERPHQVSVSLRNIREQVKEAQSRTQLLPTTQHLTAELLLLGWRLSLLRNANRAAPLIYGFDIASVFARSEAELQRITVDQLHALDGNWISSRLSQRPEGERALRDLAGLMAAVKARTGTYIERLLNNDLGAPMPGVDIEDQLLALQSKLSEYVTIIDAEYQQHLLETQLSGSNRAAEEA